jgi:hypothetical protein
MRIIIESESEEGTIGAPEVPVARTGGAAGAIDAGPPPHDLLSVIETASPTDTSAEVTDAGPPIEE